MFISNDLSYLFVTLRVTIRNALPETAVAFWPLTIISSLISADSRVYLILLISFPVESLRGNSKSLLISLVERAGLTSTRAFVCG